MGLLWGKEEGVRHTTYSTVQLVYNIIVVFLLPTIMCYVWIEIYIMVRG